MPLMKAVLDTLLQAGNVRSPKRPFNFVLFIEGSFTFSIDVKSPLVSVPRNSIQNVRESSHSTLDLTLQPAKVGNE